MPWIRNTSLFAVGVYNRDAELAAKIANTIADIYRSKRLKGIEDTRATGVRQIEEEVACALQRFDQFTFGTNDNPE